MQTYGGVAKSFAELINVYQENPNLGVEPLLTFTRSNNKYLQQSPHFDLKPQRNFLTASGGLSTLLTLGPIRTGSSYWAGGPAINNSKQILHASYYRPTWLERKSAEKLIVTVHDFIPEYLGWTGVRNPHIGKKRICTKADKIISVSHVTTEALIDLYGISEDRIETIHHGVRLKSFPDRAQERELPSTPSILYVGNRTGYKNFQVLLKSLKLAVSKNIDVQLITAGPELTVDEKSGNEFLFQTDKWKHFTAPDDEVLGRLYKKATVHVATSLMEGFGMTLLESMSYGTPTLLSNIPVFREVAGENAVYFESTSEESLLSKLESILESSTYEFYSKASIDHANNNSWDQTAQKYAKVYADTLS
jgi:glycosyltransferase involved in cell wall biosynthesis